MPLKIVRLWLTAFVLMTWSTCGPVAAVQAQLADDVRDVFQDMLPDLDDDLAVKFRRAIKRDSSTIEFTPEQFRRFRDNPINPFDGLDQVDARDGAGTIALKFELPSIRNRPVHRFERQHENLKSGAESAILSASASTVQIHSEQKQLALGVVVDADGKVLTKASEIEVEEQLFCHFSNGRSLPAKIIKIDKPNDLALLSVQAKGLTPVQWSTSQPRLGAFVITPDLDGSVLTLGSYSTTPRSTAAGEQAFLGVQPQTTTQGVVVNVDAGTASHEAGMRDGDVIFKMDNSIIRDVSDLVRQIRSKRPGDTITIDFYRNGAPQQTKAKLAGRNMNGERAARFKMMNRLGTIPSRRNDGFPLVFQHDSPLFPEQCGGPICDLDGNVIGINIARNGRAASYAIPSEQVQRVLKNLLRESLASRQPTPAGQAPPTKMNK